MSYRVSARKSSVPARSTLPDFEHTPWAAYYSLALSREKKSLPTRRVAVLLAGVEDGQYLDEGLDAAVDVVLAEHLGQPVRQLQAPEHVAQADPRLLLQLLLLLMRAHGLEDGRPQGRGVPGLAREAHRLEVLGARVSGYLVAGLLLLLLLGLRSDEAERPGCCAVADVRDAAAGERSGFRKITIGFDVRLVLVFSN